LLTKMRRWENTLLAVGGLGNPLGEQMALALLAKHQMGGATAWSVLRDVWLAMRMMLAMSTTTKQAAQ